jgi:WD40 repeat protein
VARVGFTPDNRRVVTAGDDQTARVWDLRAPDPAAEPFIFRGHDGRILSLAVCPDSRWMLTGSEDQTARLWDLTDPDLGSTLVYQSRYSKQSMKITPDSDPLEHLTAGAGGKWLAFCYLYGGELFVQARGPGGGGTLLLDKHEARVYALLFSPDDRWLVSGDHTGAVRLWDVQDFASAADESAGDNAGGNHAAPAPRLLPQHKDACVCAAISEDSRWLLTGSSDKTAILRDLTRAGDESLVLGNHPDSVLAVALSGGRDGRWAATACREGSVFLWDLARDNPAQSRRLLRGHSAASTCLCFSPDGRWLVSGGDDAEIYLWDLSQADPADRPRVLRGHRGPVEALLVTPDSRRLVSGSGIDQTVRLWDLLAPRPETTATVLTEHLSYYLPFGNKPLVAMSGSGRFLATSDANSLLAFQDDGSATVTLWNLASPDPRAEPVVLGGHVGKPISLAFSPDDRWLAVGTDYGQLHTHLLRLEELVQKAERTVGRKLSPAERKMFRVDE